MACPCTNVKPIASCGTNLIIGTISSFNTAVYVFIKRLGGAARIERLDDTTNGAGQVAPAISDLPDGFLSPNFDYEIYVTLATATPNDRETITLTDGVTIDTCFCLPVIEVNEDDAIQAYANQTLVVDA